MTQPTNIEKVTESFIAEIQKSGIVRTFEWIQGWMDRAAAAALEDEFHNNFSDLTKKLADEARELTLEEIVARGAESVTNFSTSVGHNYMKQARVAEAARMLNRRHTARVSVTARWDNLRARIDADKAAQAPKTQSSEEA